MEFDLSYQERRFIMDALDNYLDAFPEYSERIGRLIDLLEETGEVGTTLHLN